MIFKIAWRNIWRNKRRSIIILTSIAIGLGFTMLYDCIVRGSVQQMLDNAINSHTSHLQINNAGFNSNKIITNNISHSDSIINKVASLPFIKYYSPRVLNFGMITSAANTSGITLVGIEPEKERNVTIIHKSLTKGTYFSTNPNEILIGEKLAEKLEVDLNDKLVLVSSATDGSVSSEMFRVVGIFKTNSSEFDKAYVYVPIKTAQKMLLLGDNISQIAAITDKPENINTYKSILQSKLDYHFEIFTYQELLPLLIYYVQIANDSMLVMYIIIGTAVLFGIINTLLMSVFERVHEFGVLMSIGMRNGKVFRMVIEEAFILSFVGTIIGFCLGLIGYYLLSIYGLDLSVFSESLSAFGMSTILYPKLDLGVIINSIFIIPITAILGAIYPALKAIKLQPTEAMRYV